MKTSVTRNPPPAPPPPAVITLTLEMNEREAALLKQIATLNLTIPQALMSVYPTPEVKAMLSAIWNALET